MAMLEFRFQANKNKQPEYPNNFGGWPAGKVERITMGQEKHGV